MHCFLLQTFMFQLSSALTIGLHTNLANPTNGSLDPLEASEVDCVPRYIFIIHCIETRGVDEEDTFPQHFGKWVEKWGVDILLIMANFGLVATFSALKQKVVSYQEN